MARTGRACLACVYAVLAIVATGCNRGPELPEGLLPIPQTNFDTSENTEVQMQLQRRRETLERLLADDTAREPQLGRAMGELGMVYHAYEYWEQAETLYTNAKRLHPQNFRWAYYLAMTQKKTGKHAEALANLEQVIRSRPDYVPAYVWSAEIYHDIGALDEAEKRFRQALKLNPETTPAMAGLGLVAIDQGDFETAVRLFQEGLELEPDALSTYHSLAAAYRGLGDQAAMEEALGKARHISAAPTKMTLEDPLLFEVEALELSSEQHQIAGFRAFRRKDYVTAEAEYRRALALSPDSGDNRFNLALAIIRQDRKEEGKRMLEDLLEKNPAYADAWLMLASLTRRDASLDEAVRLERMEEYFVAATEADPGHLRAHMRLGELYRRTDRPQRALNVYAKARTLDPLNRDVYLETAATYYEMKRYESCLREVEAGLEVLPDDPQLQEIYTEMRSALGMSTRQAAE